MTHLLLLSLLWAPMSPIYTLEGVLWAVAYLIGGVVSFGHVAEYIWDKSRTFTPGLFPGLPP